MAKARSLCLPMNFDPEEVAEGGVIRDRTRIGASLADVDPMNVERYILSCSSVVFPRHFRQRSPSSFKCLFVVVDVAILLLSDLKTTSNTSAVWIFLGRHILLHVCMF